MISFPLNHISKKKHETNNQITSFPSQENVFFTLKVFIPFIITGNPLLPVISNRPLHTTKWDNQQLIFTPDVLCFLK